VNPLSVAIIGAGNIAGGYDEKKMGGDNGIYTHAGAYVAHGGFELKTVFDADRQIAESFCCNWKAVGISTEITDIYRGFHDVVSICTPDDTHFDIIRNLLVAGCCRTVFIEKPIATNVSQIEEIIQLSRQRNIQVVVNFQRRCDPSHLEVRNLIASSPDIVLSVNAHYMKGLQHIGITMVDTITYLCGYPTAVQAFNRVLNREIDDYSYEFILYYPGFTVSVKIIDVVSTIYNYHVFEIDFLLKDRRLTLIDNSQRIKEVPITEYAYSGVKVLNEREAKYRETGYKFSMRGVADYVFDVTIGNKVHTINTPQTSYNNQLIINCIVESYAHGAVKLFLEPESWKK